MTEQKSDHRLTIVSTTVNLSRLIVAEARVSPGTLWISQFALRIRWVLKLTAVVLSGSSEPCLL